MSIRNITYLYLFTFNSSIIGRQEYESIIYNFAPGSLVKISSEYYRVEDMSEVLDYENDKLVSICKVTPVIKSDIPEEFIEYDS